MGCGCSSSKVSPQLSIPIVSVIPAPTATAPATASTATAAPAESDIQEPQPAATNDPVEAKQLTTEPASAPPPAKTEKKKPSLVKAVKDNNLELVDELLMDGADLEVLGMWDNTPLIIACTYGYSAIALKLIEKKANVHAKNELGATCLHYAAVEGMLTVVDRLLDAVNSEGGSDGIVKFVNCGDAKVYNRHLDAYAQRTPLASASESNFPEVVARLLSAGARIEDASADDGRTPLWLACRHSRLEVVRVLVQNGADVNTKDVQGVSAIEASTVACTEEVVLALLACGPTDVNNSAGSPLLGAVKAGKRGATEALLTNGALVQLLDEKGNSAWPSTPLHEACVKPNEYLVSLLVRARADPSLKNAAGLTAFDLLRKRQLPDGKIVSLLSAPAQSADADGSTGGAADGSTGGALTAEVVSPN